MKLKIEKRKDGMKAYVLRLMDGEAVAEIWDDAGSYDPARIARLFQSAEELLEFAEDSRTIDDGGLVVHKFVDKWTPRKRRGLVNYVKTGDKDDMVTLRMPRKYAEKVSLLKFEVRE